LTSKSFWPKTLEIAFLNSIESFQKKVSNKFPSELELENAREKNYKLFKRAFSIYSLLRILKFLAVLIAGVLSAVIDYKFGLAIGFYLIYFDINNFDTVNSISYHIEGRFNTSLNWQKNRLFYFISPYILLIASIISFYFYFESVFLVIFIIIGIRYLIENSISRNIASSFFRHGYINNQMLEQFENHTKELEIKIKRNEFLAKNPNGIKFTDIQFFSDYFCEYSDVDSEIEFNYDLSEEEYSTRLYLAVYSKFPIKTEELIKEFYTNTFEENLIRLVRNERVEFFYQKIDIMSTSNLWTKDFIYDEKFPEKDLGYFVISKEEIFFSDRIEFLGEYPKINKKEEIKEYVEEKFVPVGYDITEYDFGIKNGKKTQYYLNGIKYFECEYKNGILSEGHLVWKYEDGKIKERGGITSSSNHFPDEIDISCPEFGIRTGIWERFDKNGILVESIEFKENNEQKVIFVNEAFTSNPIWERNFQKRI
jgi:antitoxin component YwqK of YwqJK toxin-antitoxin module